MTARLQKKDKTSSITRENILISTLLVVQDSEPYISSIVKKIYSILAKNYTYFEILIVDNGSNDLTVQTIRKIQMSYPNIRLVVLSKQYDPEIAIFAGLENSIGDYIALIDIHMDPPSLIPKLIEKAFSGYDVVIVENKNKQNEPILEKILSFTFYKIASQLLHLTSSSKDSYSRVLSRRALNSIIKIRSKNRFLKYVNQLIGFPHITLSYSRDITVPKKKKNLLQRINTGINMIISNSLVPLRLATTVGFIASLLNLIFLGYIFIVVLVKERITEGWITTSVMNATMFFLLFSILTVVSEYIARILEETKDQPLYFIAEEYTSSSLPGDTERLNVV